MKYYAGLDVSLLSVAVCVIDGDGKVVLERSVGCEINEVVACLELLPAGIDLVGFEPGTMSQSNDVYK